MLHRGAGAYICGEETALLESLEGKRGQPRTKPPFPAIAGLYASPTAVNNVESITTATSVLEIGGAEYAKLGLEYRWGLIGHGIGLVIHEEPQLLLDLVPQVLIAEELGIPEAKLIHNIHKYGNTTAATIPLLLWEAED